MNDYETGAPIPVSHLVRTADRRMREAGELLRASRVLEKNGDEIFMPILDQSLERQREALALYEFALLNGAAGNC